MGVKERNGKKKRPCSGSNSLPLVLNLHFSLFLKFDTHSKRCDQMGLDLNIHVAHRSLP